MIPRQLAKALSQELHEAVNAQPRYLTALIDMARVPPEQRQELEMQLAAHAHPLLLAPGLEALQPLGAMLIGEPGDGLAQSEAVLARVQKHCAEHVQAWITSVMPAPELTLHLGGATYALGPARERYLLRYYDPLVTPVLHQQADRDWVSWFFAPVLSWWFPGTKQQEPTWYRIRGQGHRPATNAPPLHITDDLWQALESDPLPHRLLRTLEAQCPQLFTSDCSGVRLSVVQAQLDAARQRGLTRHEDLTTYVMVGLAQPWDDLATDRRWRLALERAVTGIQPLHESLAHLHGTRREGVPQ
ncbi:DUF4123 domain-containing protein [Pseudomonas aeruginosa]